MLYAVLSKTEVGRQCGIDRDGKRQLMPEQVELMRLDDAQATRAKFGGTVVSEQRLFSQDFEVDDDF